MGEHPVIPVNLMPERIRFAFWEESGLKIRMTFAKIMAGRKIRGKSNGLFGGQIQCISKFCGERFQAADCQETFSNIADFQEMCE